ncbi:MAG: hypothetical protein WC654_01760 [Patescibacteria group bacterium]
MTNSLRLKKAITIAVAGATILWTVGLAAFVPTQAQAAEYGDLIMGETLSTVYYYGSDGQRYSFPNEKTYFSWYADFDDVVEISDEDLADITLAGNIVARPGSHWIKIQSDEKVYAVSTDGSIHWVESEEVAEGLAGSDWNTNIDDVPDVFFVDYTVGDSLTDASAGYDGMLWTDGTSNYLISGGELRLVSDDGFDANMFQDGFVLDGDGFDADAMTAGDDLESESAALTDAAQMVETEEFAETQDISVSLSDDSPSASTIVAGQAIAHVAAYDFENSTSSDVVVTSVKLTRKGVSSDTTLSDVYLFDGWIRVTDSATISSGVVSWNDTSGLFTIPAGETRTIDIRSNVAASTSGQTVGVTLDPDDVGYSGSYDSTGSSLASAVHTIASSPSTFGTVAFATAVTPGTNTSLDPQDDYRLWEESMTISNNESYLYALRFRNIGSVDPEDVQNWDLYVAGVKRGSAVVQEDENGYIVFDLSADPLKLNTGTHVFKVLADLIGGSTRTVTVGLRYAADAVFVDEDYGQAILVTGNTTSTTASFAAQDGGTQTISSGTLTYSKKSDSASGDVVNAKSSASLASFEVKAAGEAMKVESLNFNLETTVAAGNTAVRLRNGAIYVDGTQVGSTSVICGNDTVTASACTSVGGSAASYSTFTFGSAFIVYPGSPVTMEIKADIFDSDGTNQYAASDTIRLDIDATSASSNVLRKVSGSYISSPGSDETGNTLTVRAGTLNVARSGSYANQTAIDPKTAYKIASFTVTAATTETINLTQFSVDLDGSTFGGSSSTVPLTMNNLYLMYGPSDDLTTSVTKSSATATGNAWSVDYALGVGETIYVNVYGNLLSTFAATDTINADLTVSATAASSGATADATEADGQTITLTAGAFSTALGGASPVAKAVAAGQTVEGAQFKFTAANETYTIDQIALLVPLATAAGVIDKVQLYDGTSLLGSAVFDRTSGDSIALAGALVTGLSISIPAGTSKTITAKLVLNDVGTGAGAPQNNLALSLDSARNSDSQGTVATDLTDRDGNEIRAYNSIPTVSAVDLTNSTLVNGQAIDLYKFTVTANSNGPISIKQMNLPVTFTDTEADIMFVESFKLYKNGTDISSNSSAVVISDEDGTTIEGTCTSCTATSGSGTGLVEGDTNVYLIWDTSEEVIAAGETVTYTVRATPQGFDSNGTTGDEDYFTIYLAGDTTAHNSSGGTVGVTDACLDDQGTGEIWQLGDTAAIGTACTSTATGSTAYNFIWSDSSLTSHDGTETTAADWANGWLILNLDLSGETWAK